MIQRLEITDMQNNTACYSSYDFFVLLDTIMEYPGLPKIKSFSVKVTLKGEYTKLCALCDEQGLDKASVELVEPIPNF